MKKLPKNHSSGQAVLIILLVMAVILTIGLSVVSRSVTDINISQQSEDSARAFSAAEAGIEQALLLGTSGDFDLSSGTKVNVSTREVAFGDNWYIYPTQVSADQIITVWLSNYNNSSCVGEKYCRVSTGNNLSVYWGNPGTLSDSPNTPAIEVSIYYLDGTSYKVGKYALDPYINRISNPEDQGFCVPGGSLCTGVNYFYDSSTSSTDVGMGDPLQAFQYMANLDLSSFNDESVDNKFPLFARLRLLYSTGNNPHYVGVTLPNGTFPSQGRDVSALGTSGDASSKVHAFRPNLAPPAVFDFVLYSGTDLHHEAED
jgi:hypothetical protein